MTITDPTRQRASATIKQGAARRRRPAHLLPAGSGPAAGIGMAVAAAVFAHAGPALSAVGPLRRRLLPELSGMGRPGGVALTFDDGPDPAGTPAVLDALARLGWSATFFMLGGQVRAHPDMARRVAEAGHEIAVHGDSHVNHLIRTPGALREDLRRASEVISEVTGAVPRWYRPPYGVLSGGTLPAAREAGLQPVLWTAWGKDWTRTRPELIAQRVLRDLREGGTVLLHDSDCTSTAGSWRATTDSLPLLAAGLHLRGWSVRTLSQHMPPSQRDRLTTLQRSDIGAKRC